MTFHCVTLSRNQGHFLAEAIESVLNQNVEVQYIVYDVGSTDNSRHVISQYTDRIDPILIDSDLGPADGLNRSLANNSSDLFYYLNADDRLLPGSLSFALEYFEKFPECDVLHGAVQIIDKFGTVSRTMPAIDFSLKAYALGYSVVYQQATFFRSKCLQDVQFNIENRTCWDGELIVDLALAGFIIHKTNTILGQFRIYPESITGSGRFQEQIRRDHARIAHKILGRELRKSDIFLGLMIGKFKAILRRTFGLMRVRNLN